MHKSRLTGKLEFWQQLVITLVVGIGLLAAATSVSISAISGRYVKQQIVQQAVYLTDLIARQSRLSLLYKSQTAAAEVGLVALQFPDVVGIVVVTEDGEELYREGQVADRIDFRQVEGSTSIYREDDDHMVFLSPVLTENLEPSVWDMEFNDDVARPERIGSIGLVFSKDSLKNTQSAILRGNVGVSIAVALVLVSFVILLARRMMNPLNELSRVMNRARAGEMNLRATQHGPKDIASMQQSFNTMIEAIEYRDRELRKARDVALETAHVKSQFAANVSHELRTPMNSVLGMLDLLSHLGLKGRELEYVQTAKGSAQSLLELIDDILSYVHADSGEVVITREGVDIQDLLENVVTLLASQALRKKINLGYRVSGDISHAQVDYQRLKQVLINLVGNAIKFTDAGYVGVYVTLEAKNEQTSELVFSVRDTGIGIKPENQERIFEAFTQEDATTTRKYGGTGLGLAISRQFVRLMGGDIILRSEPMQGSEFVFRIPVSRDSVTTAPVVEEQDSGWNVIVADSSPVVRDFATDWLTACSARFQSAADTLTLLNHLNQADESGEVYTHLLIEEHLPGLNFTDLLRLVQAHECCRDATIIVMVNPWIGGGNQSLTGCVLMEKPLTLPRLKKAFFSAEEATADSGVKDGQQTRFNNKRVLIVDDNHANRLVARGMLEQFGCEFDYAENGQEAIDKISRKSFDLVLMDCNMPVLDGYDATRTIRKLENAVSSVPIIAMTANNSSDERDKCLAAGMDEFVIKPLSLDVLRDVLHNYFGADQAVQVAPVNAPSLIEKSKLEQLRESVGEVFVTIVEAFIDDLPMYLATLREALSKNDAQQVYELAHTIKGSTANLGITELSETARRLEQLGKSKNLREAETIFQQLESYAYKSIDDLKYYLRGFSEHAASATETVQGSILLADDDRTIRMSLANVLRNEGYRILEASNGQSVLALCSRAMPDMILVDAIMPELDGFETCKRIRQLHNGTDVPILMVTSLDDEQSITRAFNVGATDYVTKPINYAVLKQRVFRLLQTSRIERHVRELAYRDVLTGLPNRAFFNQQLRHKISRANLNKKRLAVLFLDLDRFKIINDSLGHDAGDLILKAAAERINRCVRTNDLVARLGGDEFTVVLEDIANAEVAGEISRKICESLRTPFVFLHQRMFISASVGIALYPNDGVDMGSLVKHADTAMFKAKESGRDFCYYEPGMEDEITEKMQTERDLRSALERDEIILFYQPQVELSTGEVIGFETLARWNHPDRGILPAGDFISIAEEVGLIGEFARLAFEKVCKQLEIWYASGLDVRVAVNVSGDEFQDGRLRQQLFALLDKYTFPLRMLEIEITETMLMEHPELAQSELALLREKGLSIAIDDFGSGFSSLNYLKRFSVDVLKIDQAFVRDCQTDKNDRAIISGVITLAKSLNLKVIAEGVEMLEQAEFLREVECDIAQGYYFGRPVSPEDIQRDIDSGRLNVRRRGVRGL